MTVVLHSLGLHDTMDTWGVAMGGVTVVTCCDDTFIFVVTCTVTCCSCLTTLSNTFIIVMQRHYFYRYRTHSIIAMLYPHSFIHFTLTFTPML
jgi:hypothetical protein